MGKGPDFERMVPPQVYLKRKRVFGAQTIRQVANVWIQTASVWVRHWVFAEDMSSYRCQEIELRMEVDPGKPLYLKTKSAPSP